MSTAPIDFYFDFGSPYGYLASERIDAIAAKYGREARWHPHLLGVVFKSTGAAPLPTIPLKGPYSLRDVLRSARYMGIPCRHPSVFPISTVTPARAFYWLDSRDPARAKALAHALYRAYFADDVDISGVDTVVRYCERLGVDPAEAREGMTSQAIKDRTRVEVEDALSKGVFGSPFMIVDGEPFWGADRLDQVERWLATGGW